MAKVGIDVDGVVADFIGAFNDVINSIWPGKIPKDYQPIGWDYPGVLTKAEMSKAWRTAMAIPNFWLTLLAHSESMGSLARWLIEQKDQEVYFVTSRGQSEGMNVTRQTELWFKSCGLTPIHNYMGIIVVPDSNEKWKVLQSGGFDYFTDDKGETIQQVDMIHPALYDVKGYLFDRPWNQDFTTKRRVKSMQEFLGQVK